MTAVNSDKESAPAPRRAGAAGAAAGGSVRQETLDRLHATLGLAR